MFLPEAYFAEVQMRIVYNIIRMIRAFRPISYGNVWIHPCILLHALFPYLFDCFHISMIVSSRSRNMFTKIRPYATYLALVWSVSGVSLECVWH